MVLKALVWMVVLRICLLYHVTPPPYKYINKQGLGTSAGTVCIPPRKPQYGQWVESGPPENTVFSEDPRRLYHHAIDHLLCPSAQQSVPVSCCYS